MASEIIEVEGHIIDSLILAKVMDQILAAGADYRVLDVEIGKTNTDTSRARIEVTAADADALAVAARRAAGPRRQPGRRRPTPSWSRATATACLPAGFYSTTNLPTVGPDRGPLGRRGRTRRWTAGWSTARTAGCAPSPCTGSGSATWSSSAPRASGSRRPSGPGATPRSSSWTRRCRRRSPRACSSARWPTGSGWPRPPAPRCWRCAARRSSTPAPARRSPPWCGKAGSTCCSPATASPPTTSSPT